MFDTLKFARTLRDRGHFTPEQAEGLADAVADAFETEVVTAAALEATEHALRREIADLRAEVKAEIAELRAEVKAEIAELRAEVKAEIAELRAEVKAEIAELRLELRTGMRSLEARMEATQANTIKWVVGIVGFQGVAFVAAVYVMARGLAH